MRKLIAEYAALNDEEIQQVFELDTADPNAHRTAAFAVLFTFHPDFPVWILNLPTGFAGIPAMENAK